MDHILETATAAILIVCDQEDRYLDFGAEELHYNLSLNHTEKIKKR